MPGAMASRSGPRKLLHVPSVWVRSWVKGPSETLLMPFKNCHVMSWQIKCIVSWTAISNQNTPYHISYQTYTYTLYIILIQAPSVLAHGRESFARYGPGCRGGGCHCERYHEATGLFKEALKHLIKYLTSGCHKQVATYILIFRSPCKS